MPSKIDWERTVYQLVSICGILFVLFLIARKLFNF